MDAAGAIATYVLDGDRPLTATSNGNTTFYLYGLGGIGEQTTAWSYSLPDGTNTPRQLSDLSGDITLSARYTPWGDSLEIFGTGNFTFGYLGGVLDATTGLLYVGNGQYYDPATGRFLTRDVYPNSPNPYVPWGDPTGALFAPLALVGLIYGRKKKKSKFDYLVIVLFVAVGVGMGLSACVPSNLPVPPNAPTLPQPIVTVVTMTPNSASSSTVVSTNTAQCPPPDIINYDPAVAPPCISWNPSMSVPLSPSVATNAANSQLEPYAELIDPNLEMGGNLCGQIDLTMIANADLLYEAWMAYKTFSPTTAATLLDVAMKILPGEWAGKSYIYSESRFSDKQGNLTYSEESWSGSPYGSDADSAFQRMLSQNHYVIANVQINVDEQGWSRVTASQGIPHWVIVTGMSSPWDGANKESATNWVRINNPYNNRAEYYPWKDFKPSLGYQGWSLVELWQR